MFPRVVIASRVEAGRHLLSTRTGGAFVVLVSIGEAGEKLPAAFRQPRRRLRLEFSDIAEEVAAGIDDGGPMALHIERLVAFAPALAALAAEEAALVHCQAGVSRSTAAAFILFAAIVGPGREREALDAVYAAAPHAYPNRRMVRLADEHLGRGGAMLRALDERRATPAKR
jgi:predicted protein tyrosine phosphatase